MLFTISYKILFTLKIYTLTIKNYITLITRCTYVHNANKINNIYKKLKLFINYT